MTNLERFRQGLTAEKAAELLMDRDCGECPARELCRELEESGAEFDCRESIERWLEAEEPSPPSVSTGHLSQRERQGETDSHGQCAHWPRNDRAKEEPRRAGGESSTKGERATLCMSCVASFEAAGYQVRHIEEEAKRRVCRMCGAAGWFDNYEVKRGR